MEHPLVWIVYISAAVLAAAGAAVTPHVIKWLQTRRALARNEHVRGVLVRLTEAVVTAVKATQQQTVESLKERAKDGKLTSEEMHATLQEALGRVRTYLGEHGIAEAKKVLGGAHPLTDEALREIVAVKVEAAVLDLKQRREEPRPVAL